MPKIKFVPKLFEDVWDFKKVKISKEVDLKGGRAVGVVSTNKGKYFFKVASNYKSEKGVEKDTAVFDALREENFQNAPRLIKTKNNRNFIKFKGKLLYLIEYISGRTPKRTTQTYRQLARITARLHDIKHFPFETDFKPSIIIKDLLKNSRQYAFGTGYQKILKSLPDFSKLSQVVIHTDIAPTNSIQKRNGDIIFVDWDDAGIGPMVLDLGGVLNEIIREDMSFDKKHVMAFYKTYFSKRMISKAEKKYIFDGCLFFACMYIIYGDMDKRWKRILWLIEERSNIEALYI